jgi:rod shape determining protein RodA
MGQRGDSELGGYDWLTISLWGILVLSGWLMIFASGYIDKQSFTQLWDLDKNYGKQLLWIGVGLSLIGIVQLIEVKFYETFAPIFYGIMAVALVGVLFTTAIKGATSWYSIGSFRLQPSEFAKVTTALMLSYFLSMPTNKNLSFKAKLQSIGILLLPAGLVLLQGDAGSTLVYFSLFLVLFLAGMDAWIYALGVIIAALSISALLYDTTWWLVNAILILAGSVLVNSWKQETPWLGITVVQILGSYFFFSPDTYLLITILNGLVMAVLMLLNIGLKKWQISLGSATVAIAAIAYSSSVNYIFNNLLRKHQQERIWVWLRPEKCDPLGPLYNLEQSKFAIGSGGWTGKGFLQGERTKLDYVPEQSTDFIFCTVGEEWGYLGTSFIIIVFFALIFRVFQIANRQRSSFARFYAYCVASILFFHVFINIGMTIGLVPVIGIPLPFISYGGSSLMSFSILMGILIKLDSGRLSSFR